MELFLAFPQFYKSNLGDRLFVHACRLGTRGREHVPFVGVWEARVYEKCGCSLDLSLGIPAYLPRIAIFVCVGLSLALLLA